MGLFPEVLPDFRVFTHTARDTLARLVQEEQQVRAVHLGLKALLEAPVEAAAARALKKRRAEVLEDGPDGQKLRVANCDFLVRLLAQMVLGCGVYYKDFLPPDPIRGLSDGEVRTLELHVDPLSDGVQRKRNAITNTETGVRFFEVPVKTVGGARH